MDNKPVEKETPTLKPGQSEVVAKDNKGLVPAAQKADGDVAMKAISVEVPALLADFAESATKLFVGVAGALKDGFQVGNDLPVIISEAVAELGTITKNASAIVPSVKQHPLESLLVVLFTVSEVLKKK